MTVLRNPNLPAGQTYETDSESLVEVLIASGWEPVEPDELADDVEPDAVIDDPADAGLNEE
jgi:hypothetical protein